MYSIWPGSSRKRLPIAQIALKTSGFAFCCLFRQFYVCLSIESENKIEVGNIAKNRVLRLLSIPKKFHKHTLEMNFSAKLMPNS